MRRTSTLSAPASSAKLGGAAAAIALHVIAFALLLQLQPVRSALTAATPIMVQLISPRAPREAAQELPKPLPLKPRVQRAPPVLHPQVMTAPAEAPSSYSAPLPPPAPVETVAAAPVAPPALPAPAPVIPPRFNAEYLNNPAPAYPAISRRTGEEGKVILRVLVNDRGMPEELQLRTSSGSARLDNAAIETVRHWKFVPARRGDTAVDAWVLVPISFSLRT